MRSVAVAVLIALITILLPMHGGEAQQVDYLIVPGQRFGRWELGKPVEAYELGQPRSHSEASTRDGVAYTDSYSFPFPGTNSSLRVTTCKSDKKAFAVVAVRRLDQAEQDASEINKYKTDHGIGIGSAEADVRRLLGQPENTTETTERHGSLEVQADVLDYSGLRVLVNRADRRTFGVGVVGSGGWSACQQAVIGRPPAAQPGPAPAPVPTGIPVTISLPVPMPSDLRIIPPVAAIPPERAAFSGVWVGKWNNILDTALAVREITPSSVSAVYSWGRAPSWNISREGWTNGAGRFAGPGELHIQTPAVLVVYRMRSDGRLDAEFQAGDRPRTIMTKVFPR